MPCWSTGPDAATAATTRPGSSTRRWGNSCACGRWPRPPQGSSVADGECLFCRLARAGEHVRSSERFVAIRDIHPKADVHLLVLPRRHIPSFRDVGQLAPEEAKEMVDFVAATAREAGLDGYRLQINVGRGGGQEVLHLHWHVLGRWAA